MVNFARTCSKGHDARRTAIKGTTATREHVAAVALAVNAEEVGVSAIKNEYEVAFGLVSQHAAEKPLFPEQLTKQAAAGE